MKHFLADHIVGLKGYTYGEQPSDPAIIKLNTNENPYPPSPAVQKVIREFDSDVLCRYPDATATTLREAIARYHNLSPTQVLVTNGADEAIRLVATACLQPHATLVSTEPGYSLYPVIASLLNARYLPMVLSDNFRPMSGAADRCVGQRASLVCITNPNTPSGVLLPPSEIEVFASRFKGPLLIDEAYVDFVEPRLGHDLVPLLARFRNLLLMRTFSKGYSLAGARVGYLLGNEEVIEQLSTKVRDSYNVNSISQILALAALHDQVHARRSWAKLRSERTRVLSAMRRSGYQLPASEANYVLLTNADQVSMEPMYQHLRHCDILVRYFDSPRLKHRLRITIGTPAQNDALLDALDTAVTVSSSP